ncbi:MAG: cytochrome c oxidase subunit 1 [Verrucomicrobiales bacterium]|jgi:cytochrome c oxidase subunit 1
MATATSDAHAADHAHDDGHDHHESPFWKKYFFSTDHKMIGMQYGYCALFFLAFGFYLMLCMRWSIAYPGEELPWYLRTFLIDKFVSDGVMNGSLYNMFGAMHGTIMVFLGIVPLGFAAFGNYVTPLQIGAVDMAFPRLNMASFWCFFIGGLMMLGSFFMPSGAAQVGWTNYSPLATTAQLDYPSVFWTGQTMWLSAMVFIITSSLLGAVNFVATIINLRAKGMTWMRMPFFVWAMMVTGFLLLLAFPPLEVAAIMQLMDRLAFSSFFVPSGLLVNGQPFDVAGGGSPLLYQHLFWFLGHPEVYVLLLPSIAIVAEVIPANTRKPLWGYRSMVYAVLTLGFLSFIVWAHHMYMTGMGAWVSAFFQTTTVLISIPSVILLTCLMISLWGGSIRFTPPMLWATAFLPMFGIGGLTGLPLAFNLIDLHLHDTYYVIGHFHYVVAPGVIFGLFAGIYHWYPNYTGRMLNGILAHLHFWPSLIAMNLIFAPMMVQGVAGFHRRWYDGGLSFPLTTEKTLFEAGSFFSKIFANGEVITLRDLNVLMTYGALMLAVAQIPFIINFFGSIVFGKKATSDNPWGATTLEWATPTPPPHGNFIGEPIVDKGPYEYSVPGEDRDFSPQWDPDKKGVEKPKDEPAHV